MSQQEKRRLYRLHLDFYITHREMAVDISAAAIVIHKLGGMAGGW